MASHRKERGQATVELALVLPVLFILVAVLAHVGLVVAAQVGVEHAAREGARAAAVEPDRATSAATAAINRSARSATVSVVVGAEYVTVTVKRTVAPIPIISKIAARTVEASATMRREDLLN